MDGRLWFEGVFYHDGNQCLVFVGQISTRRTERAKVVTARVGRTGTIRERAVRKVDVQQPPKL